MANRISKVLSPNDTGETGGHQAGILVPKDPEILGFFPPLDASIKNPRAQMLVRAGEREYMFNFIYYNGKFFGGTRNEYRLTGMSKFFRDQALRSGDTIVFERDSNGDYMIDISKNEETVQSDVLVISSMTWKVIKCKV